MNPQTSIVPIVGRDIRRILGTGFFVGTRNRPHIVTAKHVFEMNPLDDGGQYGFIFSSKKGLEVGSLENAIWSEDYDVAACPITPLEDATHLQFGTNDPELGDEVSTYGFSGTGVGAQSFGGMSVMFEALAHKGYVMRVYKSTHPESIDTPSLQVSFPGMHGASGSPVMATNEFGQSHICGMMVANIEREALREQAPRNEGAQKFVYPHGKLLSAKAITPFLEEIGVQNLYPAEGRR